MQGSKRSRTDSLQILLIEDDPSDARLFEERVREGGGAGEVRWEEDLASGLSAIEERRPDVVVVDLGLSDREGPETIDQIAGTFPEVPVVVLIGQQSEETALSTLEAGATEYLRKAELTPGLLARTLRWAVERKSMERKLEKRERDLRSITENITEGIYRSAPDEGLIYVNQAFADLFGYGSPEEIMSIDPVKLYVRPERRQELRDILRREGSFQNEEVKRRRKDGSTFTALQSGSVIRDETGEIVSFDGAVTDITKRKEAQKKLEESEKRVRSVLDTLAANVAVLDRDGTIIDVNRRWKQFARENDADLDAIGVGANYLDACAPAEEAGSSAIPAVRKDIRAVAEGEKELFEYQYPCHSPDEERWFLLRATPLGRDEGGAVIAHINVTERVQALRKQHVLSAAVEQAQEAVLITEAEAIDEPGPEIVYVNSAVEEMTGYAEEELLGQTPRLLQGPDTEREVLDSLREALEAGDEWTGETVNYRKDGTPYRVQWSIGPVRDEDGEIVYWVSVQRDVTEERKREKRLTQMAQALDQVGDKVVITDREGQIQYVNEAFGEITGYREEEVVGKTPAVLQSGEQDEAFYEELWETILSGETFRAEFVNEKKDGTQYVEDETISPVANEEGEITHFVSSGRDITDRKEAEQMLRDREQRLRGLTNSIPGVLYQFEARADGTRGFSFVSDRAEEILGLPADPENFLERAVERTPDSYREVLLESIEEAIGNESEWAFEAPFDKPSGERIWIRGMSIPDVQDGNIVFNGVLLDITERKAAERALEESEELHRATLSNITDAVLLTQEDGTFSYVCPNVGYIFGYDEEEVEALGSISALLGSDPAEEHDFEGTQEISNVEHSVVDASGDRHDLLINIRRVSIQEGRRMYTCRDITERKQAEEALREREAQLRGLANSIPGVVYQFFALPDGTYGNHFVSDHAETMLGISPESEEFFERVVERIPSSHRDRFLSSVNEAVEQETTWRHEFPFRHPSGQTIWLLGTSTPERRNGELVFNGVLLDVTERKEAEQALAEREEYLSVTLQSIGDAVVATDRDGCVTEMNSVAERLTGWSQEEAKGKLLDDVLTLHSARTGESLESPADEVLRVGETVGLANHTVLTSRDGTEYQIADSAAPIQSEEGDLLGVVLVFRDVTEKYERRRQMERQNDLFSKAQDLAQVGAWEYDVRSDEAIWTEEVYRIHGLPPGVEASPEQSLQFYHEEDRPVIKEAFARAVEEGEPYDLELRLITADGDEQWIRTRGEPQTEDGEVARVRGTIQDVTEQKEYERELERMTDLLRLAEEMTDVGGWSVDTTGDPPYQAEWTEELYEIFELPRDEAPPTENVFEYYHPEDRERHQAAVHRAQETGEGWDQELRLITAEDRVRWVHNIGVPIMEEGEVVEIRGAMQDITEQKERERELRAAKEKAERMNQLKSAFLANMSHEVRTPLTSIIGFAEIIGDEVATLDSRDIEFDLSVLSRYSRLIQKGGQRLMETLEGVLDLSKLEAGEMSLSEEEVDLREEATDIVEQFEPQARDAGLDLQVGVPEEAVRAHIDPEGLRMALRNLVSNAIKYTEEGGQVWVRVRRGEEASVVEVEDTGIGMDPERVPELFEAFVQESEGIGREYEGSGLGLTVTKKVVNQMGGSIEVSTEKGEGSCFTVRLPRAEG